MLTFWNLKLGIVAKVQKGKKRDVPWAKDLHSKCISSACCHRLLGIHCPRMPVSELECSPWCCPDFLSLWTASAHLLPVLQQWQEFHSTEKLKQVANKGRFTSRGERYRCWNNKMKNPKGLHLDFGSRQSPFLWYNFLKIKRLICQLLYKSTKTMLGHTENISN